MRCTISLLLALSIGTASAQQHGDIRGRVLDPSGPPAKYGDVTGGVVVIETRTYLEMYNAHRARMARQAEAEATEEQYR